MKQKTFSLLIMVVLVLAGLGGTSPAKAQGQAPVKTAASGNEYLILFSIPELVPTDAPAGIGPQDAGRYASRIIERQYEQMRPRLERYIQAGQFSDLSLQPERAGVTVLVHDLSILTELGRLPGVEGIYPSAKSVECSKSVVKELALALVDGGNHFTRMPETEAVAATDPVINVYHHAGGTTYGWVDITTTPNIPVSLRILRGGVVVGTGTGTTYTSGSYRFYSSSSCNSLLKWELHDGDTVEVTAHGSTVSTVVTALAAWMDPGSNKVAGVTAASRQVKIQFWYALTDPCTWTTTTQTVTSNSTGAFEKTFSDFNRRAAGYIWVLDANGNSTYAYFHAYDVETGLGWEEINIHWKAGEALTATLTRSAVVKYTWHWTIPAGWDYYYFNLDSGDSIMPGDVISVSSAVGAASYTVVPLTVAIDAAADKITGATAANRMVQVALYHAWESGCNSSYGCFSTHASSGGAYTFSTPVATGDEADVWAYDSEGNYESGGFAATPYLVAELERCGDQKLARLRSADGHPQGQR